MIKQRFRPGLRRIVRQSAVNYLSRRAQYCKRGACQSDQIEIRRDLKANISFASKQASVNQGAPGLA